jgi:serine/threonine-protein kinase
VVNRTDEALGRLAVAHGLVSEVELRGALDELTARGQAEVPGALGTYLVEQGSLTINQLERLMGAAAAAAMKVPKVGPYRLLEKLGAGGMGAVYRAERASDGQVVALKVLPRSKATDDEFLNRFEHEARAAFELSHPNIVKGLDMGQADGYHYIAMEFVDGRDLFSVLEERGKLPVDEALRLVIQIAGALEHAHTVRLVHRDIKPDNILIDRSGRAKLTDLGLVMEEAQAGGKPRITKRGLAMGTPFYFSPEQARGEEDIDTRSDIYALGATFYEMVTGKPPFEGESAAQVMLQHIQDQAANPRDIDRSLPDGLCRVIEKMMAKDREDRYQTPTELLGDLQLLAAGQEPKNADLKPWDATLRRAGGGRPPRSRSKLAPVNFSDVPLAPARATGRVRTVTGGRPRRTTRARRTTRERTTRERTAHGTAVPDRLPRWVVAMAVLLLAAACALAGFVVHRLTRDGKDRPGSAPANGTGGTPERSPGGPEKGIR